MKKREAKVLVALAGDFVKNITDLVKEEYKFLRGLKKISSSLSLDAVEFSKDGSFELKGLKAKTTYKK